MGDDNAVQLKPLDPIPISYYSFYTKYPHNMIQNHLRDLLTSKYGIDPPQFGPDYYSLKYTVKSKGQ